MNILTDRLMILPCIQELIEDLALNLEDYPHVKMHLEELREKPDSKGWGVWFVFLKESNKLIGDIGFKGKPQNGVVEIGYGIREEERRKGYAFESVQALLSYTIETGRVSEVTAECLKDNIASIHVLKKLGMECVRETDEMYEWSLKIDPRLN